MRCAVLINVQVTAREQHEMSDQNEQIIDFRELVKLVEVVHTKVTQAQVLNGGFDRLSLKIDRIEDVQKVTAVKVDNIHDAIYDPDEGLYARVKNIDSQHTTEFRLLEQRIENVESAAEEVADECEKEIKEDEERLKSLNKQLDELKQSLTNVTRFVTKAKWIGGTLLGAVIAAIAKYGVEYGLQHIAFR